MDEHCACCGGTEGMVIGDRVTRLDEVHIISKFVGNPDDERTIIMCQYCTKLMPFNLSALVESVNRQVDKRVADDALLEGFIRAYITDVWPETAPPSYQVLCRVINAVGILSPRGSRWEYHNLQQRMTRLEIDREAIMAGRAKASYTERMDKLIQAATEWTAQQYADKPYPPAEPAVTPTQHLDEAWITPSANQELPSGIPFAMLPPDAPIHSV